MPIQPKQQAPYYQQSTNGIYSVLFNQLGTSNPTIITVNNTLYANPVWTRVVLGRYRCTLANAFLLNRVFIPPFDLLFGQVTITALAAAGAISAQFTMTRNDNNSIDLIFMDGDYNLVEYSSIMGDNPICLPTILTF